MDAMQWFEERIYAENYMLSESGMQLYKDWMPDWNGATANQLSECRTVEIPLMLTKQINFIFPQAYDKFEKTKDPKYLLNDIRLVIETNSSTGHRDDFIMKIVPSLKYLEQVSDLEGNSYLNMDENFDGIVFYYDPNWNFVNGVRYSDGKVTGKLYGVDKQADVSVPTRLEDVWYFCLHVDVYEWMEWTYNNSERTDYSNFTYYTELACFPQEDYNGGNDVGYDPYPNGSAGSGSSGNQNNQNNDQLPNISNKNISKAWWYGKNGVYDCLELCKKTMDDYGYGYGSSASVYRLTYETIQNGTTTLSRWGDNPVQNYQNAKNCIDEHLDAGRPIIVGLNEAPNAGFNEGTTDHFVVIHSRTYNFTTGLYEYIYYENGVGSQANCYSDERRLIYNPSGPDFYDPSSVRQGVRYDVTQVRPNDGNNYPQTTTAYPDQQL